MVSAGLRFCRSLGNPPNHCHHFAYCTILLAIEVACFLFLVAGTHGLIVPLDTPTSTDFVSFYAAGSLADAGRPELAYDRAAHRAAEERATAPGVEYRFFYYPPVFLLLCALLARLPYLVAFVVFEAASLVAYLIVMRRILDERGSASLVPVLASPAVFWTLGLGQNAFLTASLFGAGTLCIDRRPITAGLLFGALCYKPHFGLLIPLAFAGLVSPFGAVLLLGGTSPMAYAVQAGATISAGLLVGFVWRSGFALPIRAATLAAATLIAIPVILIYDLTLAGVAVAWLVRAREGDELPIWEKAVLAGSLLLLLNPRGLAEVSHIPIAPVVALALVVVVTTRVFGAEARSARVAAA